MIVFLSLNLTPVFTCGYGAQWNSRQVQGFVECSFLSDDQQSHIGNDIEDQKDDFEQPEERVDDHVEGFSGNGKPFALHTIHQIRDQLYTLWSRGLTELRL